MTAEPKHTPGRLEARKYNDGQVSLHWVHDHGHTELALVQVADHGYDDMAIAESLAECWNNCKHVNPEAVPKVMEACKRLEIQARHANQLQHAGVEIGPAVWSDLHESCNAARAALALAETKP